VVIIAENSRDSKLTRAPHNSKTSDVAATYVAQQSCHSDCPLKGGNGCYAEEGNVGIHTHRINGFAKSAKQSEVELRRRLAKAEAKGIRALDGSKRLRVHVVGDCATKQAAGMVGRAMVAHQKKHGKEAWTYTHSWRHIRKQAWAGASVIASCENPEDVAKAQARGYATALVVPPHRTNKVHVYRGVKVIPCPAQFAQGGTPWTPGDRRAVVCTECNLCPRPDNLLARGLTVGFAPDGQTTKRVLKVINA
jgi:hypothetical protein